MVYPIIDVPISASAGRDLAGEHALITLAQETGGKYYYADASSLDKTFAQLSEDLRTMPARLLYPSNRVGSSFRSISVKLRTPAAGAATSSTIGPGIILPAAMIWFAVLRADPASKRNMRLPWLLAAIFLSVITVGSPAQEQPGVAQVDSDQDGMSDALEQALLVQFRPTSMVGQQDCSSGPAEFRPGVHKPPAGIRQRPIYGQVFSPPFLGGRVADGGDPLLPPLENGLRGSWPSAGYGACFGARAGLRRPSRHQQELELVLYWYSAAHENTVCDVSQIARASTLHAEEHGAKVWISPGKHASYLNQTLCQGGCGADKCANMVALAPGKLINLGGIGHPMNGSLSSRLQRGRWLTKWRSTELPGRPCGPPQSTSGKRYRLVQRRKPPRPRSAIAVSSSTEQAIASGGLNTTSAISVAGDSTNAAVSTTGKLYRAMRCQKSYRNTQHALGTSARHVGEHPCNSETSVLHSNGCPLLDGQNLVPGTEKFRDTETFVNVLSINLV